MRITEPGKFLRKLLKKETPAKVELTLQDGTLISLNMGTGLVDVNRDGTLVEKLLEKYKEKPESLDWRYTHSGPRKLVTEEVETPWEDESHALSEEELFEIHYYPKFNLDDPTNVILHTITLKNTIEWPLLVPQRSYPASLAYELTPSEEEQKEIKPEPSVVHQHPTDVNPFRTLEQFRVMVDLDNGGRAGRKLYLDRSGKNTDVPESTQKEEVPSLNGEHLNLTRKEELQAAIIEELRLKIKEMEKTSKFVKYLQATTETVHFNLDLNNEQTTVVGDERLLVVSRLKTTDEETASKFVKYLQARVEEIREAVGLDGDKVDPAELAYGVKPNSFPPSLKKLEETETNERDEGSVIKTDGPYYSIHEVGYIEPTGHDTLGSVLLKLYTDKVVYTQARITNIQAGLSFNLGDYTQYFDISIQQDTHRCTLRAYLSRDIEKISEKLIFVLLESEEFLNSALSNTTQNRCRFPLDNQLSPSLLDTLYRGELARQRPLNHELLYPLSIPEELGKPLSRYDIGILISIQTDGPVFFTSNSLIKHNKDTNNFITLNPYSFKELEDEDTVKHFKQTLREIKSSSIPYSDLTKSGERIGLNKIRQ